MTRPVVAFFACTLSAGTPRGALRLFRGLVAELAKRDDIELVCLGEYLSDADDPVGCLYERHDGREFVTQLDEGSMSLLSLAIPIEPHDPEHEEPPEEATLQEEVAAQQEAEAESGFRATYRHLVPLPVRRLMHPVAVWMTRRIEREPLTERGPESPEAVVEIEPGGADHHPSLFAAASADRQGFDNSDIIGKVISLDRVDILLNFWWFHSPFPDPLIGRYRPAGLRVISWFLDAIPLRVARWQPGLIPVTEFRGAVQSHLEMADQIIAISTSGAQDVGLFFPHISKPIHVVPCGVFDSDFVAPENADVLRQEFAVDPSLPLFAFIGFQEPSKNVLYGLRALLEVSRRIGQEVQALIIGLPGGTDLRQTLGPLTTALAGRVRVISSGVIDEPTKRAALSGATALVYVSKWEGFGIPPLEAMAAGTPVVAGDIAPLRENCGDLAEYCDPYDVTDIAAAILRIMERTPQERAAYAIRSREWARRYSWAAAADRLLSVLLDQHTPLSR